MSSRQPPPAPSLDERPRRRWRWPLRAAGRRLRRAGGEEGGLSLIEVLVASALGLIVTGALVSFLVTSQRQSLADIQRPQEGASAGQVVQRINHELRQTYKVLWPTSRTEGESGVQVLDVLIRSNSGAGTTAHRVIIDCELTSTTNTSDHMCYRYQLQATELTTPGTPPSGAKGTLLLDLVANKQTGGQELEPVFQLTYNQAGLPDYGLTTLRVPESGAYKPSPYKSTFVYSEGFYMPNLALKPES